MAQLAATFPDAVAWRNLADGAELTLGDWHRRSNRLGPGPAGTGARPRRPGRRCSSATKSRWSGWCRTWPSTRRARWPCRCWPGSARSSSPGFCEDAGASVALCSEVVDEVRSAVRTVVCTGAGEATCAGPTCSSHDDRRPGAGIRPRRRGRHHVHVGDDRARPKGVVVRHGGLSTTERVPSSWLGLGFLTSSPFATTSGSLLVTGPLRGGLSGWFLPRFSAEAWVDRGGAGPPGLGLPGAGHGRAHRGLAPLRGGRSLEPGGRHRGERADRRGHPPPLRRGPADGRGPVRVRDDRVRCRHRHADGRRRTARGIGRAARCRVWRSGSSTPTGAALRPARSARSPSAGRVPPGPTSTTGDGTDGTWADGWLRSGDLG